MAGHAARPAIVVAAVALAAACEQVRGGRPVACPHGNDPRPLGVSLYHRPT